MLTRCDGVTEPGVVADIHQQLGLGQEAELLGTIGIFVADGRRNRHLTGLQWLLPIEGMNVFFVLDRSDSVPSAQQEFARSYINKIAKLKKKVDKAVMVGKLVAERAKSKGIDKVDFDRNGFLYHCRIKAVSDGAREAGLQF